MYCRKLIHLYALILSYCTSAANAVNCQPKGSNISSSCYCHEVSEHQTPWSTVTDDTAPSARNASISFFLEDDVILPRISWTVSVQYLHSINGFYIEVILLESEYQYFSCSFDSDKVKRLRQRRQVSFHYKHCCRKLPGGLQPDDHVHTLIISLPLHSQSDNGYFVTAEGTVPEEEISTPTEETPYDETIIGNSTVVTKTKKKLHPRLHDDTVILIALSSLAGMLFLLAVGTVVICLRRKWKKSKKGYVPTSKSKRILFISDEEMNYTALYNGLIESMKKCSIEEVEVVANIRRQNETASCSIIPWITRNMKDSDAVVIVASKSSQLDNKATETKSSVNERSTVTVALNIAQSEAIQCNFENMRKRFIILHIGAVFQGADLIPYCTHYAIPKHVEEAMKQILGANYNTSLNIDDVIAFLLKQLSSMDDPFDDESRDTEYKSAPHSNDLNQTLIDPSTVDLNDLDKSVLYYSMNKTDNDESLDNNMSIV